VRPSFTYDTVIPLAIGGWDEYTVIDRMKKGKKVIVHGDGTSLWTITHAEDFARGFVGLLGNVHAVGHPFHITSDEALTWDQIYKETAQAAGVEANIVHIATDFIIKMESSLTGSLLGDKSHSAVFDNSKIKDFVPGFRATIPFSEGVRRTLEWFDESPRRKVVRPETNAMMDRIIDAYEGK
jgi:nucleoside-diphosphate-sugar epimerase